MLAHRASSLSTWLVARAALVLIATLGCGGGSDGGDPPPVAPPATPAAVSTVAVSASTTSLTVGQTLQLSATMRDAAGNALSGRAVSWTSNNAAVASVNAATGAITAVAAGTAIITATSEGRSGSLSLTVAAAGGLRITAVTPAVLVEGQQATITGAGFDATAANNVVSVDGVPALVVSATATDLQVVVPSTGCRPDRLVAITVSANAGSTSASLTQALRPASYTAVPVGQQVLLSDPSRFCVQLPPSSSAEEYLVGVQSISEVAAGLTPATVTGEAGTPVGVASGDRLLDAGHVVSPVGSVAARLPKEPPGRAAGQVEAELARHALEDRALRSFVASGRATERTAAGRAAASRAAAAVPTFGGNLAVGDSVTVRIADIASGNGCTKFTLLPTVVRAVGTRTIWVEDTQNPAGGFAPAEYGRLQRFVDDTAYGVVTRYFGEPTDLDANARVVVVITKELNRELSATGSGAYGYVTNVDLAPDCPASNGGEVYYTVSPDVGGTLGPRLGLADATRIMRDLFAHEFTHAIQTGRRFQRYGLGVARLPLWESEGQATLAQEIVAHAITGRSPGQNYGADVVFNSTREPETLRYRDLFDGFAAFYGFQSPTTRAPNAPEQCTWLAAQPSASPCTPGTRIAYSVPWSLLRWINDQFGPSFPGGESALQRTLIDAPPVGFEALRQVTGRPIDELLTQWAAMLYVDDRVPGAAARLTLPSWNLFDIARGFRETALLAPRERAFANFSDAVAVAGGSVAYFRIGGGTRAGMAVRAATAAGSPLPAHMRMWIVRLR